MVQTFDADYMSSQFLLKLHRDSEVSQCIGQFIQSINRRVNAFEAVDLLPDRQWRIIRHIPRSSSIHCCTAIVGKSFQLHRNLRQESKFKSGNNQNTYIQPSYSYHCCCSWCSVSHFYRWRYASAVYALVDVDVDVDGVYERRPKPLCSHLEITSR